MIGLVDALAWKPAGLADAAWQLQQISNDLDQAYATTEQAGFDVDQAWSDDAARAAHATVQTWLADVLAYSNHFYAASSSLTEYAEQLGGVHAELVKIIASARSDGYSVGSDGVVTPPVNPDYSVSSKTGQEFPKYLPDAVDHSNAVEENIARSCCA